MSEDKSLLSTDPNGLIIPEDEESQYPGYDRSLKLDDCSIIRLDDSQHRIDAPLHALHGAEEPLLSASSKPGMSDSSGKILNRDPYAGKEVYLNVEGGQEVFYHGAYVTKIPLSSEPLLIGRRDVMAGHYPDVDLALYWKQDRCLSRKHLRIFRDASGCYYVEDLCHNNATFLNSMTHPLNKQRAPLKPGDRIFISMSIVLDFCVF